MQGISESLEIVRLSQITIDIPLAATERSLSVYMLTVRLCLCISFAAR